MAVMASSNDRMQRALIAKGAVRLIIVDVAEAANVARKTHGLGVSGARFAAQGLVATALLSAHIKGDEQITFQFRGTRPKTSFTADISASGELRARLVPADFRLKEGAVLDGLLLAIKSDHEREIYRGATAVKEQSLEQALAGHLNQSTQVDALLRIGVSLTQKGELEYATGLLIERLPEDPEQPSIDVTSFVSRFGDIRGKEFTDLRQEIVAGTLMESSIQLLEERALTWRCGCSLDKVVAVLQSLGRVELESMVEEEGRAEVSCDFCGANFRVSKAKLKKIIADL